MEQARKYEASELAFVVPTRERPEKLGNLLTTLAGQTVGCGPVIVVASGEPVEDVVSGFADKLDIRYCHSEEGGQIRQRNLGMGRLDDTTRLVGSLDDDIVLEPEAVERILALWNGVEPETAGVAFNIVNNAPYRYPLIQAVIGLGLPKQGRVFRSGYNVATSPVADDLRSEWLCGGATTWRREIMEEFKHRELKCRWAVCEDLIFSYPIGRKYPLYVCAGARVRHEHIQDHTADSNQQFYGRSMALWRLYFVESHDELSRGCYCYTLGAQIIARWLAGVFTLNRGQFQYARGLLAGGLAGLRAVRAKRDIAELLEEK